MKMIPAIYKNHAFKPLKKVEFEEGAKVMIRIEKDLLTIWTA